MMIHTGTRGIPDEGYQDSALRCTAQMQLIASTNTRFLLSADDAKMIDIMYEETLVETVTLLLKLQGFEQCD